MKILNLLILSGIILIASTSFLNAQTKIGYVDSKRLVDALPESRDAQQRLDNLVTDWQNEIRQLQDSLENSIRDFENKKLILTEELKAQLEQEITTLRNFIETYRVSKFGENGEYFQKQVEFMKPVQEKIYDAISRVAEQESFDYVFDRNSDIFLLFVNERYDLTQKVIRILTGN